MKEKKEEGDDGGLYQVLHNLCRYKKFLFPRF